MMDLVVTAKDAFEAVKKLYPDVLFIKSGKVTYCPHCKAKSLHSVNVVRVHVKTEKNKIVTYDVPIGKVVDFGTGEALDQWKSVYPPEYQYLDMSGIYYEKETTLKDLLKKEVKE